MDLSVTGTSLGRMLDPESPGGGGVALRVEVVDPVGSVARRALRAHMDDIASRWYGRPATTEEIDRGLVEHPSDDLRAPDGLFLVAQQGPTVLGCAGLRFLGEGVGEVTRVYVAPPARGKGLGRRLMLRLEQLARERRVQTLRLDTRSDLVEARAMYASLGYVEVPAFNKGPFAQHWFSKTLPEGLRGR